MLAFSDIVKAGVSAFAAGGGGSAATVGTAVVDFGAGADTASVVITGQAGITATSFVMADLAAIATADHSADEHVIEPIVVTPGAIVPGAGFTIFARTGNVEVFGKWTVKWMWSN